MSGSVDLPGMTPQTRSVRESYDVLADEYARRIYGELMYKPLDRELLDRFASEIKGRGVVCDMGCGPGHVARYLKDRDVHVFGLDLSTKMLEQARMLSTDIEFVEGNMMSLDLEENSLAGITAFYAIVNIRKDELHLVFSEMRRVLRNGGQLLLAFHVGDSAQREELLWGRAISMDFFLFEPRMITQLLREAGFKIEEIVERGPYAPDVEYQSRRVYIFASKQATY